MGDVEDTDIGGVESDRSVVGDAPPADAIEVVSDGENLALVGDRGLIERFLSDHGLQAQDLDVGRLTRTGGRIGAILGGASIASQHGRWLKMTTESAEKVKELGLAQPKSGRGVFGVMKPDGPIKEWVTFENGPATLLSNPAVLSGVGAIMTQMAVQAAMDEIVDYLASIDEKVDDILRSQRNAVIADMIGVDAIVREALITREQVGGVSDVTWSKVQGTAETVARTQAYALGELGALAEKVEEQVNVGKLSKAATEARELGAQWLAVLAHCFSLQDAIAILELDRVLEADPDQIERHRVGLQLARRERLELAAAVVDHLAESMNDAAKAANAKKLLHPIGSGTVVSSHNELVVTVDRFRDAIGAVSSNELVDPRLWKEAAGDAKDRILEAGASGLNATKRAGRGAGRRSAARARSLKPSVADRTSKWRKTGDDDESDGARGGDDSDGGQVE